MSSQRAAAWLHTVLRGILSLSVVIAACTFDPVLHVEIANPCDFDVVVATWDAPPGAEMDAPDIRGVEPIFVTLPAGGSEGLTTVDGATVVIRLDEAGYRRVLIGMLGRGESIDVSLPLEVCNALSR